MPKNHKEKKEMKPVENHGSPDHESPSGTTAESTAYLRGLFTEFLEQKRKYSELTERLLSLEARIELSEKTLCLTRDHFSMTVAKTQDALPNDWNKVLRSVRYVGVRLADACAESLREHGKMTPEQLLRDLNDAMFRFRTNSPLREIHAALLRHPHVKKCSGAYVWIAPPDAKQVPMRLRAIKPEFLTPEPKEDKPELKAS
jgi:hypothetical protein